MAKKVAEDNGKWVVNVMHDNGFYKEFSDKESAIKYVKETAPELAIVFEKGSVI